MSERSGSRYMNRCAAVELSSLRRARALEKLKQKGCRSGAHDYLIGVARYASECAE